MIDVETLEYQRPEESFESRIRELLDENDMSQKELCHELGLSQGSISPILNGYVQLNSKKALKIAEALDCNSDMEPWDWVLDQVARNFIEARKEIENERINGETA